MDAWSFAFLILAGVGAGLVGSVAGLASLVSYPALLAYGLAPVAATVTNTVAILSTTAGSVAGSRAELRGQGPRLAIVSLAVGAGGAVGAVLLLTTPEAVFARIVPWLIAIGALSLLARDRLRSVLAPFLARSDAGRRPTWSLLCCAAVLGVYGGYFGAAAGIIMLALLSVSAVEPIAVSNAVKNVVMGAANVVAGTVFAFLAPVDWAVAGVLALGCFVGSWIGPSVVRRVDDRLLRGGVAAAGLGLAGHLWWTG
ncbi:sulfite exporter TauE/SafE family protein [Nocardiopsis ansamitocini]|uniref:Probable membrane transporter protein n=1 Tax=Nocardiopsis ansamitocini TaxID=1670832 RepID=A0A9W6PA14_9ACTN|nr:sulfite exporter TauE/SafE family protein [Nocardiopsis ansamitocini]GLU49779.1 UPF0721 transmembrane protein [Nocardiopsis ansamitocini]